MTVPTTTSQKPAQAQRTADQRLLQRELRVMA